MSEASTASQAAAGSGQDVAGPSADRREQVSTALVVGAVVVAVAVAVAITPNFLSVDNVRAILRNAAIVGIVAVAMTPITLSGNFISLGTQQSAMAAMVLFIALVGTGWAPAAAIAVVLVALVAVGVIQGLVVAAGLNPVITTLAAGAIIFGVVADATDGQIVRVGEHAVSWGNSTIAGVPLEVLVFLLFTIAVGTFMTKSVSGREMILAGANRETAEVSGISFRRVTIGAFVIFSIGLAIAGVLTGAGFGEATIQSLSTLTIDSLAAILVGGTAITGGYGSPWRSAGGAVLIAVISNVMVLNDFSTGGRLAVQGAVVVVVVILLELLRRRGEVR
ncbi:MAG TPA: ABC transporter permease [Solirubrobacterales bacterium]|nr:ABC transporter permease [Solirubrobacterales bacterium]